jgi:hypothetical protein
MLTLDALYIVFVELPMSIFTQNRPFGVHYVLNILTHIDNLFTCFRLNRCKYGKKTQKNC